MSKQERTQLWIREGATITNNGRDYIIVALADVNMVLAKEAGSGEKVLLKIGDLGPPRIIGEAKPEPRGERDLLGGRSRLGSSGRTAKHNRSSLG
jgi:putative transposase